MSKKFPHALLTIFTFSCILAVSNASAESYSVNHEKVKVLFQGNEEKTAKDAVWTARDIFKVSVINDGKSRDGYASYICEVLYDFGFKGGKVWVQVIDINKLTRNNKWVKLGQAHCQ